MAEFKKLSEVEQIETASDNATVLVEENGEIKRVPKKEVGGGGNSNGVATAIIRDSNYLDAIEAVKYGQYFEPDYYGELKCECLNMTFEEAYQIMASGEPLNVIGLMAGSTPLSTFGYAIFGGEALGENPSIGITIATPGQQIDLFWTANGISIYNGEES